MVTLVIWNHEPAYESPARKSFRLDWQGELTRADFSVDVDPNFWLLEIGKKYIEKIVVNGSQVSFVGDANDVVVFDARQYLRKGENVIEIHHNGRAVIPGIQTAGIFAFVTVESSAGSVGGVVVEPPSVGMPWWILALLGVLVLVLVLRK